MSQGVITYLQCLLETSTASVYLPTGHRLTPMAPTIDVLHVNSDRQGERTSIGYRARRTTISH